MSLLTLARRRNTTPRLVRQLAQTECGLCCCASLLRTLSSHTSITDLRQRYDVGRDGLNVADLSRILRQEGAVPHVYETTAGGVALLRAPAICYWNQNHYVVAASFSRRGVVVLDPGNGRRLLSAKEFEDGFSGIVITAEGSPAIRRSTLQSPLSILLQFASEHWRLLLAVLTLSLLTAGVTLAIPQLLEAVFTTQDAASNAVPYLTVCGLGLAYALILLLRSLVAVFASTAVGRSMSERVFDRLLRLPYAYFANRGAGDLLFTLEAVQQLRSLIATDFIVVIVGAILVASLLVWLATMSLPALGVAALLIGALVVLASLSTNGIREASLEETRQRAELQSIQVAAISGLETIKSNAREAAYFTAWRSVNNRVLEQFVRLQSIRAVFTSASAGIQFLGPILVLVVMTRSGANGTMGTAMVVSIQALSGFLLGQVSQIAGSVTQVAQGWALLERIADVLLHPEDDTFQGPLTDVTTPSISLSAVTYSYATFSAPALRDISLEIPAGSKVAIVGPSGCGKSTLGRLLVGLSQPTSGVLKVGDERLRAYTRACFYASVAYVPQTIVLDRGSVRDNITWGAGKLTDELVVDAARRVGLHEEIASLPLGYETPVAHLGQNFSGGQRQRIALARAALKNASIVVLDEATSSLDNRAERLVTSCFDTLKCTQVVIAHRLSTVIDADIIFVLDDGRLVQQGTHEQLMRTDGLYPELYTRSLRDDATSNTDPSDDRSIEQAAPLDPALAAVTPSPILG